MLDILLEQVRISMDALLLQAIGTIVTGIVGYIAYLLQQYLNIRWEEKHQRSLTNAAVNAAKFAVDNAINGRVDPRMAVQYFRQFVPDAVKHFNVNDDMLRTRALPEIHEEIRKRTAAITR